MFGAGVRAELVAAELPDEVEAGGTAAVVLELRNEGSVAWDPGMVEVAPVGPRDEASTLCHEATWASCDRVTAIEGPIAPGQVAEVAFLVHGPAGGAGTSIEQCWNLVALDSYWFGDEGQGGPGDDEICHSVGVVERHAGDGDVDADGDSDADSDSDVDVDGDSDGDDELSGSSVRGGCACGAASGPRLSWLSTLLGINIFSWW